MIATQIETRLDNPGLVLATETRCPVGAGATTRTLSLAQLKVVRAKVATSQRRRVAGTAARARRSAGRCREVGGGRRRWSGAGQAAQTSRRFNPVCAGCTATVDTTSSPLQ